MNDDELRAFEFAAQRRLAEYTEDKANVPKRRATASPSHLLGYRVRLAVRNKALSLDTLFVHDSRASTVVEAEIDARRKALAAGWRIIGHVHDITPRYQE